MDKTHSYKLTKEGRKHRAVCSCGWRSIATYRANAVSFGSYHAVGQERDERIFLQHNGGYDQREVQA